MPTLNVYAFKDFILLCNGEVKSNFPANPGVFKDVRTYTFENGDPVYKKGFTESMNPNLIYKPKCSWTDTKINCTDRNGSIFIDRISFYIDDLYMPLDQKGNLLYVSRFTGNCKPTK